MIQHCIGIQWSGFEMEILRIFVVVVDSGMPKQKNTRRGRKTRSRRKKAMTDDSCPRKVGSPFSMHLPTTRDIENREGKRPSLARNSICYTPPSFSASLDRSLVGIPEPCFWGVHTLYMEPPFPCSKKRAAQKAHKTTLSYIFRAFYSRREKEEEGKIFIFFLPGLKHARPALK